MEFTIEKTEKDLIENLKGYKHEVIEDCVESLTIEMDVDDVDELAKESGQGEYFKCRITKYGNTEVVDLFYNWLTDDWEHYESHNAEIHQMTDDEIEEYEKDRLIEENAEEHPRYEEYQDYCKRWQSNFNSQYAYHNGNKREASKIMGSSPLSFSEYLKVNY